MNPLFMSILLIVGLAIFTRTMVQKIQLLMALEPTDRADHISDRIKNMVIIALGQKRLVGRKKEWASGIMHAFIFWGFCILLIRSLNLYGEGFVEGFQLPLFGDGSIIGYLYIALKDIMEGIVLVMAGYAIYRRAILKPERLHNTWEAYFVLCMIMVLMISDLLLDGARYNLIVLHNNPTSLHFFNNPQFGAEFAWTPYKEKNMGIIPDKIWTWQMVTPFKKDRETGEVTPGKLEKTQIDVPELQPGEVLVEVAGCGVCHTDLGYFYYGVPTVNKPPLTLGHEISGVVVDAASDASAWKGKEVIIPAVMPCRKCYLCKTGRGNRCMAQKMPGNSMGIYGGFSSHIPVPAIDLCEVKNRGKIPLEKLAVVADAATTPFQATKRADVQVGDNAIVIGVGGVGQYMVQTLKALGCANVVAIDINQERLDVMLKNGADFVVNSMGKTPREISGELKAIRKTKNIASTGWKIFEVSGSKPGQELGLALLSFTGKMVVVGFGPHKVEYSISRLMAFDAELIGTWGCLPEYYPSVLSMITSGKINFEEFVQTRPMSTIAHSFDEAHKQSPDQRIVLVPDF